MSKTQEKIQVLTAQVAVVGRIVKKLSHPKDSQKSDEKPVHSNEDSAKAKEELEKNEDLDQKNEELEKSDEKLEKSNDGEGTSGATFKLLDTHYLFCLSLSLLCLSNVNNTGDEDTDCTWVRTHIPTDSEEAEEKRQHEELIKAANVIARGKSERVRRLASTQEGKQVIRRKPILRPKKGDPPKKAPPPKKAAEPKKAHGGKATGGNEPLGYNPFAPPLEERKTPMLAFVSGLPGYCAGKEPDKVAYPEWHWWFTLLTGLEWLSDSKLDERLHPGTTVHRGTRFILPSIGLTGAPCQCLVGSHIVIWYHTRPRQLTRLSSESSSLHAQPPRCQSGWALTCENALDYTFLNNMWLDTPHVLST
ncbi:unnamed protein product [Microthlaspi erraticum]|uniref:Uncharacterized protein n=1 Tax=Microthlaspi erraticum TaxID=1685480 RepID=A0A6D2KE31_9BRAS|nr:unnamed protein product [Microthlaspi erraticum]